MPQKSDANLSASELRQRYHKGGSAPDSDLSAAQLRARYGVQNNSGDFSTKYGKKNGVEQYLPVVGVCGVIVIFWIVYSFLL